ncbi:hypothetical protein [Candidatus Pelagibacter sp.]|uniref:hypothetical protein n=1 Tax=Candidatus Pelagibacter sp. TaxID=2024849 RepID=UPI003F824826
MSKIKTTPVGEVVFPWLTQPDTQFKSEGEYHTKLRVTKDKAEEHIKTIKDVIAKQVKEQHDRKPDDMSEIKRAPLPYKETEDGYIEFNFKMKASGINSKTKQPFTQKPNIVDGELNPFPEGKNIFGGSMVRINYEPVGYNVSGTGVGCTLRLKTVQVIKLVESSNHLQGLTVMTEQDIC